MQSHDEIENAGVSDGWWFAVLGPVRAGRGETELNLGAPQQKSVLAALLLHAGQHVSLHEMVDWLWGEDPPRSAEQVVRTYVYRLRRVLDGSRIRSVGTGYVLDLEPGEFDLATFRRLTADAEKARVGGDLVTARTAVAEALQLCTGEPLADLPGEPAARARSGLTKLRLNALEMALELDIELGRHNEAAHELAGLVAAHPLDERFRRLLMLALHRSGQRAEALAVYAQTRALLADELGIDPGPALQSMHLEILRAEAAPAMPAQSSAPAESPATPAQLPADLHGFTGRARELSRLDELVPDDLTSMRVVCVHGMAGTGKTSLAVHWAHSAAGRFPDGQVFLNLRGFDPSGDVMEPDEALHALLESFGVPVGQIPQGRTARTALLRTALRDRRVLFVLDNVRSPEQVRPLLPGTPGCAVLITSRDQLPGMVAIEHAQPVRLDVLSYDEARAFLSGRIGADRARAEQAEIAEIVNFCGGLPLALTIVAARAVLQADVPLATFLDELRFHHGTLGAFRDSDTAIDARAVFSWSYRGLTPSAARLFRLLSVHPGDDLSLSAAASIGGLPVVQARGALSELTRSNLLREHVPGRYLRHDLLRAYGRELLSETEPEAERRAAMHRMFDYYLHTARPTVRLLRQHWKLPEVPDPLPEVTPEPIADERAADAWLAIEFHALVACVRLAGEERFDEYAWQVPTAVAYLFQRRGHWLEQSAMLLIALESARRLGDRRAEAMARRAIGAAYARLNRVVDAEAHLREALTLFDDVGDLYNKARTYSVLSFLHNQTGDHAQALADSQAAYEILREDGDEYGIATSLNDVGWAYALLGQYGAAVAHCRESIALFESMGMSDGQASALDSLAYAYAGLGLHDEAIEHYTEAIDLFEKLGDPLMKAEVQIHVGDSRHALGEIAPARELWEQAAAALEDLRHPLAGKARERLSRLD